MSKNTPKIELRLDGVNVPTTALSFKVLHNGGAVIGIKANGLKGEVEQKASSKTAKVAKATTKSAKLADGVRFENGQAVVRLGGEDIQTIDQPKVDPKKSDWQNQKAFRKAVNSFIWSISEGEDREAKVASPQWAIHLRAKDTGSIPIA